MILRHPKTSLILKQMNLLLIVAYIPPSLTTLQYQSISDILIKESSPDLKTIIVGDVNQFQNQLMEQSLRLKHIIQSHARKNTIID